MSLIGHAGPFLAVDQVLDPAGAGDLVPAFDKPVQAERPGALLELAHVPAPFPRFAGLS